MTKAAFCLNCADIVAPYRHEDGGRWRWCDCDAMGVRWRDGERGLLEVTSLGGPNHLRVLGINNNFLPAAVQTGPTCTPDEWRALHQNAAELVEAHYLFHKDKRACWALIVAVGESGDVFFVPYSDAVGPGAGQLKEDE